MKIKRNLLAVAAGLIACIVLVLFSTSIHGGEETYEIHPHVAVPYGYTPTMDIFPLIDLIQHLTAQNQQITQNQLSEMDKNIKGIVKKLDVIDAKLTGLSAGIARIEKKLGIEQPTSRPWEKTPQKSLDTKPLTESSPHM
jgi:peptidoglycan hydrolase CwlO-like protein